jgi:ubiquinone/menaquinone biosynthesis C-methylase UbiE
MNLIVLVLGCGDANVSLLAAGTVRPLGSVVGVDQSQEEVPRPRAELVIKALRKSTLVSALPESSLLLNSSI